MSVFSKKYFTLLVFVFGVLHHVFSQKLSRSPYLQMANESQMTIRWETDIPTESKLTYQNAASMETKTIVDSMPKTLHEIRVKNLLPKTKYLYKVGYKDVVLESGDKNYFITSPKTGSTESFEMVILGDCGTGTDGQKNVEKAINGYFGNRPIDGWLLLGDNAYNDGFKDQYRTNFFDIYKNSFLKNTVLWPSPGNHDYGGRTIWPNDYGAKAYYFEAFTMPTQAECGGVASKSEAYYSYDYANVHFVSLDSYALEDGRNMADTLSAQVNWLKKDLAANKQMWTVVYFHHPPFSKGTHNSDIETDLTAIRLNLVKILNDYKVDLVLNGHSHNYERSYFMSNFRGKDEEFDIKKYGVSTSNGRYDGSVDSCPYIKKDSGSVYVVAGTGGWVGYVSEGYPHNAMAYSNSTDAGALLLKVENNKLEAKYLLETGKIADQFTMLKNVNKTKEFEVACGDTLSLAASWPSDFIWNGGAIKTKILKLDSLNTNSSFSVKDSKGCLKDDFVVKVKPFQVNTFDFGTAAVPFGSNVVVNTSTIANAKYIWEGPKGPIENNSSQLTLKEVSKENEGSYSVTVKYKGCEAKVSSKLLVQEKPKVIILANEPNKLKQLSVFPNPAETDVKVKFYTPISAKYILIITDELGRNLSQEKSYDLSEGEHLFDLSLKKLQASKSGLIYVQMVSESGETYVEKVILK
ncbi:purple acid phosphatase family protein [Lacihabitans lacunae]|uniref:Purple acid phosphatase family protein n=1 Tax=Lacihabitans lacunae TaxID=1028214 RepID=A0ABV7YXJ0_9BACT